MPNLFRISFPLLSIVLIVIGCASQVNNSITPIPTEKPSELNIRRIAWADSIGKLTEGQLTYALSILTDRTRLPRSSNGTAINTVGTGDWTSGFFPGTLWLQQAIIPNTKIRNEATYYTELLQSQINNKGTHDVGFMIQCSYGNGFKHGPVLNYQDEIVTAAKSLSSRYNPTCGVIRSWDWGSWKYPVIIDNMMNLELLYMAAKLPGADPNMVAIANQHAKTTLREHYRADGSCYHIIDYNPSTGIPIKKGNYQGWSDSSRWARGQAWGLYGFSVCYRESNLEDFRLQAEKIASYILSNPKIPSTKVPYWDYDYPNAPKPRDASAAAITASALLILAEKSEITNRFNYFLQAELILKELSKPEYFAVKGSNGGFLLKHSTGDFHRNREIDQAINYADYYFMEALYKYKALAKGNIGT
jgi:hypothetical protein